MGSSRSTPRLSSRLTARIAITAAAVTTLSAMGCSKKNEVDLDKGPPTEVENLGAPCGDEIPGFCGAGECVAGVCRPACRVDAECQNALCLTPPGTTRGGCRLPAEANCPTGVCSAGLVCGLDETCRTPCDPAGACPRNDQKCIEGACYGSLESSEPGDMPWLCEDGSYQCSEDGVLRQCNVGGLGYVDGQTCASSALCDAGAGACAPPACDPAENRCAGARLSYCPADRLSLVERDCVSAEACSAGLSTGDCASVSCTAEDDQCVGATLRTCRSDGSGFDEETCASSALCQDGLAARRCTPPRCVALGLSCNGAELRRCNENRLDYTPLGTCGSPTLCDLAVAMNAQSCTSAACAAGQVECRLNQLMVCNTSRTGFEVSEDCATQNEVCVETLGGASCEPRDVTPVVQIPVPGSPVLTYGIDEHEVTRFQYEQFLVAKLTGDDSFDMSGQDPACALNARYWTIQPAAEVHDEIKSRSTQPQAQVDWCDAKAYCKWAGKRLCGPISPGTTLAFGDYADPAVSQWMNACSANGVTAYGYGASFDPAACWNGPNDVTTPKLGCQSSVSGYDGVFHLSGNVSEWEDTCSGDTCRVRGFSVDIGLTSPPADLSTATRCAANALGDAADKWTTHYYVGFRCCTDPA